ncbi:MAG: electron transfer flavoprotein subunit alpha/FixB family protein [Bacteroidales bacterium]
MARIFAYIEHRNGIADESAGELPAAAARIDASSAPIAVLTGSGAALDAACAVLAGAFEEVWKIESDALAYPNAEVVRKALTQVVPRGSVVLLAHSHFGVDLAPGLSIKLDAAFLPDVVDITGRSGQALEAIRQEFGGQVSTHVHADIAAGAVITIRPGAFPSLERGPRNGTVIDKSRDVKDLSARRRYVETVVAEAGDVDITKYPVLVSVGRGIQEQDNVEIAQALADALGGAVSCSRPVVDAKWMEKSRQVGSSGKTVRPKVYLACGISGSFQHLAGIKGKPFMVAINKNPRAPIFRVADVGIVADVLEFLPELTSRVRAQVG